MRAVVINKHGDVPSLQELPEPVPAANEVKVRVATSSVNQFDTMVVSGAMSGLYEHSFPIVLGKDFAGTIIEVGADVADFAAGDEVFGVVAKSRITEGGGFGEYLTTMTGSIARVPAGVDLATAGVLGLAGAAATAAIDALGVLSGQTILVSGATGGVGAYAVQLAIAGGATVIATATPGIGTAHVRWLGAHYAVDYDSDLGAQVKTLAPNGVDAVVHLAGDGLTLASLATDGAHIVSPAHLSQDHVGDHNVKVTAVMAAPGQAVLDRLAAGVVTGSLRVPVAQTYSLDQVAEAFSDFKTAGLVGKLAISVA